MPGEGEQAHLSRAARQGGLEEGRIVPSPENIEFASLKIIASADAPGSEPQETEQRMVQGIREIFGAELAVLFQFDEEDPQLTIKKHLGSSGRWSVPVSQHMQQGVVQDCILTGTTACVSDIRACDTFRPEVDGVPGVETRAYLCAPLSASGMQFGALALINPRAEMLSEERGDLIRILASALANTMCNSRMFLKLKVSTADLEASRYELLNSRNTLRALFDNLPSSIYIVDRQYTIIAINMSRSRRAGERPASLVGRRCYEKFYRRASPCADCRVYETFEDGRSTDRLAREVLESGDIVEWEINTFPIASAGGDSARPSQVIITEYDVTEKRLLEADLIQSEKMAAIGQLAAGVAHEIYNPLTAIIANAQMVRRILPGADDDVYESLNLIEHAGTRASQVIRTLLSAARKDDAENAELDLNMSIETALSLLNHEIVKRPITVVKDLQADMPLITSNLNHLQGIWINLVMNAIDAMEPKGGQISISSRYTGTQFEVEVADTGPGIPRSKLNRIFEPYFTTKSAGHGTGLGLSVCLRVAKQHGGTIQVDSQPDKGARFTVILPGPTASEN